jgi:pyruvate-formate lyase-activating enzyme
MNDEIFITKRMPLYTGTKCNIKCKFCYYYSELDKDNNSYDDIVKELIKFKKHGVESVDITGGEPTIHKDIIKIVRKISDMGFKVTSLITNGIVLRNKETMKKLIDAGIQNFVVSIHGHNSEIHDGLTGRDGSFNDILMTLRNFDSFNVKYSINYVINKQNYIHLQEFARFVCKVGKNVNTVTFLIMNPISDGKINFDSFSVRYSEAGSYVKEAVGILEDGGHKASWKFMPLCANQESIKQTDSIYTFFFNPFDWNYRFQIMIKYGFTKYLFLLIKNFSFFTYEQLMKTPYSVLRHMAMLGEYFKEHFTKIDKCKFCRYNLVCDGISKTYLEIFGDDEFKPIPGKQFINPFELLGKDIKISVFGKIKNMAFYFLSKSLYKILSII